MTDKEKLQKIKLIALKYKKADFSVLQMIANDILEILKSK